MKTVLKMYSVTPGGMSIDSFAVEYKETRAMWDRAKKRVWPVSEYFFTPVFSFYPYFLLTLHCPSVTDCPRGAGTEDTIYLTSHNSTCAA